MPNENNRITVVEHIYHQIAGKNPTVVTSIFTRNVSKVDQVYQREPSVGFNEDWQSINLGWAIPCAMLVLKNLTDDHTLEATFKCIIEDPSRYCLLVPPRESIRITARSPEDLVVRSLQGPALYSITAIPG